MHRLPVLEPTDSAPQTQEPERDFIQVGDLARETGKTVRAIHLYEELGLLAPAARSKGRYRLYSPEALVRIRWIGKLQEMGFSLSDIQTIVREWEHVESASGAMKRMREVYARQLEETRAQKRRIEALEHELEASLAYLDTCDVCDPQRLISACECCDLHDREARVPELVLGFRAHAGPSSSCADGQARGAPSAPRLVRQSR
jgi:MerR family transcriptional regulator, copper efflux regulator